MNSHLKQILGILCALGASIVWPFFSFVTKQIYIITNISFFDMVYFRCLIPFLLTLIYIVFTGVGMFAIPKDVSSNVFIRIMCWTACVILNFISMKIMSLTKYVVIISTGPMLTSLMGYIMINERLSIYDIISCISSFCGVVLITTNPNSDKANPIVANEPWWGFMSPLASAIIASIGDILQRTFCTKVNHFIVQMWMYISACIVVTFLSLASHSAGDLNFPSFTVTGVFALILMGAIGVLGITMYMLSLKYEKAGRVAAIGYLQIFFMMLIDTFYYKIHLTMRDITGALIIMICSGIITIFKADRKSVV